MILKLNEVYKNELLKFLQKDKELNLFIIGDMINYGFDKKFLDYWADFNSEGKMIAVLMRFYDRFIVYSIDEFDVQGFSEILKRHEYKELSGINFIVEKFTKYVEVKEIRDMHFAKLDTLNNLYNGKLIELAKKSTVEDVNDIWQLNNRVNNGINLKIIEQMKKMFNDNTGRGYHIKNEENEIVSNAETTAENNFAAMIVGVCTDVNYRNCGYATAIVSKLCTDLLSEGKTVCLFYDNPDAGNIYKKIGFECIGIWSILKSKVG